MQGLTPYLPTTLPPLLLLALAAILLGIIGGLAGRVLPRTGRALRLVGNLVLAGAVLLSFVRFARMDPAFDSLLAPFGMPAERVSGGETRVPLSSDGHYWISAMINGETERFMVDTGATISALSEEAASAARLKPDPLRLPVMVRTAGGDIAARLARIEDLRFGNVVARDLDVIVTGETGVNVLGMNFLSRLKGWRVEEGVLVLTPKGEG